ncbi:unnamed protein product [Fraxinus pennsylvanica]|uniref:Protein kinase domain-containing protein n=1 Tax=Fraxinus pennsylvanica TaxID=56036 RepID=A0AAD2AET2_9LAMI|nr:unnamed protein product [Fraxinus pennsylvanica]
MALDVARGLEYLHEHCNPPVIHRLLKSSNILLDSNSNAKLSDFGLAIHGGNSNKTNIKFSGTLGYDAPEYLLDGDGAIPNGSGDSERVENDSGEAVEDDVGGDYC